MTEGQSWGSARNIAQLTGDFSLLYADRWRGGIVAGLDWTHNAIVDFFQAFAGLPAARLYSAPVSDLRSGEPFAMSERERADEALTIRASVALQDVIGEFIDLAADAAFEAAKIIGMDVFSNRPENPELGTWWAMYATVPSVRPLTDAERNVVIKAFSDRMRDLLKNYFFAAGTTSSSGGRPPEEERDHRAYCTRERLVHSPDSPYAVRPLHERRQRAKRDVRAHIILRKPDDTCSESNWTRIMGNGKRIHASIAPDTPYCKHL